jgi:hypothetical protein
MREPAAGERDGGVSPRVVPVQVPLATPRLAGSDAKPGQEVVLEAGGLQFRTVAGPDGSFQFGAPEIPAGQVTLTCG